MAMASAYLPREDDLAHVLIEEIELSGLPLRRTAPSLRGFNGWDSDAKRCDEEELKKG
jgi:hypothetical protein